MDLIELAKEIGLETKRFSSTNGGEHASACPNCGGKDRFRIWPSQQAKNCIGTYWCRQCEKKGDAIQFCRDFLGITFQQAIEKVGATVEKISASPKLERSYSAPNLVPPNEKWSQRALEFVSWASRSVRSHGHIVEFLKKRGVSLDAIVRYKIGYCDRDIWMDPREFGLESEKKLFLAKGIVMPTIEPSGQVVRLKIRRSNWRASDKLPKYWAVKGSMNGLNIVGSVRNPVMVVVESELDAFSIDWACGDKVFTVAVGSNTKTPDNVVDYWANRRRLLICHDNDEGGLVMNEKWKRLYPNVESFSVPIELGKDVGEAVENGLDLREWINRKLYLNAG